MGAFRAVKSQNKEINGRRHTRRDIRATDNYAYRTTDMLPYFTHDVHYEIFVTCLDSLERCSSSVGRTAMARKKMLARSHISTNASQN